MGLFQIAGPTTEPVLLAEAKAHCRIDDTDEDGLLAGYIIAARQHVETHLRRALITQTWDLLLDHCWPTETTGAYRQHRITLPKAPLISVTSVSYVDSAGVAQTLATNQYLVSNKRNEGVIDPAYAATWPDVRNQVDAITVRFVAGYGSNPGDVPEPIRQAILLLVGHWFENREAVNVGSIGIELPFAIEALLFPYRIFY